MASAIALRFDIDKNVCPPCTSAIFSHIVDRYTYQPIRSRKVGLRASFIRAAPDIAPLGHLVEAIARVDVDVAANEVI